MQAKISREKHGGVPEYYLSTTHNGYQWTSIRVTLEDMKMLKELLKKEIEKLEKNKYD